eukprot:114680_1
MNACIKGPNGEAFTVDCDGDTSLRIETWSNDCWNGNSNTSFISTSNVNGRCEGYMGASGGCNGDYLYVRTADGCDSNGNLWSNSTVEAEMIINQCLLTDSGSMHVHCENDDLLIINYFHDQECNNYNYDDNVNSGCFNLNGFAREFDCSPYVNNGGGFGPRDDIYCPWIAEESSGSVFVEVVGICNVKYTGSYKDGCDSNGNLWSNSTVEAEMIINQCLLTDSGSM